MGALDSECSWRLQSEGEPDTQEDFGVKDKHKLEDTYSVIHTTTFIFIDPFYLNSVTKFDGEAALRLNVTKKKKKHAFF